MKKFISFTIVLFIAWIAFAGISVTELITGLVISVIIAWFVSRKVTEYWQVKNFSSIFKFIFLYIPLFIYKLMQSNFQMAKLVLSRDISTNSGLVKIHTDLKTDVGRYVLANSITLTPGTITVDINDDELLVHWIDIQGETESEHYKNIAADFEKVLRRIFE